MDVVRLLHDRKFSTSSDVVLMFATANVIYGCRAIYYNICSIRGLVFSQQLHKAHKNYHVTDMYNLPHTSVCFELRAKQPQITVHVVGCFHTEITNIFKYKLHLILS
jgi:hypothetical protein